MDYKEKIKENALYNYKLLIMQSWTYDRLTTKERERLSDTLDWVDKQNILSGNYKQRWDTLNAIYHAFLSALDYSPIGWREEEIEVI